MHRYTEVDDDRVHGTTPTRLQSQSSDLIDLFYPPDLSLACIVRLLSPALVGLNSESNTSTIDNRTEPDTAVIYLKIRTMDYMYAIRDGAFTPQAGNLLSRVLVSSK